MIASNGRRWYQLWIMFLIVCVLHIPAYGESDFTFHRVLKASDGKSGEADRYESVPEPSGSGSIYVEKAPSLRISVSEVESVLVERQTQSGTYIRFDEVYGLNCRYSAEWPATEYA